MRKRRSDAKLLTLPEATQRAIFALDNLPLHEIQTRLAAPEAEGGLGVGEVAVGTISDFLKTWRMRRLRERLRDGVEIARGVEDEVIAAGDQMDAAIMAGLREWIFDSITRGLLDPKDAKGLVGLILKGRQQDLDARKVALLEQKAAAYDAAIEAAESGDDLTAEQRLARIREGLKV